MQQEASSRVLNELYKVVLLLASHEGTVEERLADIYFTHIQTMDAAGFSPEAQVQFEWIREQLKTMFPVRGKLDGVDRPTAVLVAQSIILLHYAVRTRGSTAD